MRTPLKPGVNSSVPEGLAVPAPLFKIPVKSNERVKDDGMQLQQTKKGLKITYE
jgi:hypothetical protein